VTNRLTRQLFSTMSVAVVPPNRAKVCDTSVSISHDCFGVACDDAKEGTVLPPGYSLHLCDAHCPEDLYEIEEDRNVLIAKRGVPWNKPRIGIAVHACLDDRVDASSHAPVCTECAIAILKDQRLPRGLRWYRVNILNTQPPPAADAPVHLIIGPADDEDNVESILASFPAKWSQIKWQKCERAAPALPRFFSNRPGIDVLRCLCQSKNKLQTFDLIVLHECLFGSANFGDIKCLFQLCNMHPRNRHAVESLLRDEQTKMEGEYDQDMYLWRMWVDYALDEVLEYSRHVERQHLQIDVSLNRSENKRRLK